MNKATLILTADEVREELSLDADSMSVGDAIALSQYASDKILMATGHDFGDDSKPSSIAVETAKTIVYQRFYKLADNDGILRNSLAECQDVAREIERGS